MSWVAHDLEPYAIQKHTKLKLAFVPLLIGSYSPDMMTKWFVYGIHLGPWELKASDPAQFHRGWPGFGFSHSFIYGIAVALIFWKVSGSKLAVCPGGGRRGHTRALVSGVKRSNDLSLGHSPRAPLQGFYRKSDFLY